MRAAASFAFADDIRIVLKLVGAFFGVFTDAVRFVLDGVRSPFISVGITHPVSLVFLPVRFSLRILADLVGLFLRHVGTVEDCVLAGFLLGAFAG